MTADEQSERLAEARPAASGSNTTAVNSTTPAEGQWITERPESSLARGLYPWPAWGVIALGSLVVIVGLALFIVRLRRSRKS